MAIKVSRIYTGKDNRSHFEEIDLPSEPEKEGEQWSLPVKVKSAVFRKATRASNRRTEALHHASKRLLVIKLSGRIELRVGDGTKQVYGPGHVHILEDMSGEGHAGRLLDDDNLTLMLELADE